MGSEMWAEAGDKSVMNCKDFHEMADSYLGDELLVETNHDVLRHLESCAECRDLLASRREVRSRLRETVKGSEVSRIDPAFSVKMRKDLRAQVNRPRLEFTNFRFAIAGIASVFLVAVIGFVFLRTEPSQDFVAEVKPIPPPHANTIVPDGGAEAVQAVLVEMADDAIGDHKNCALTHNLKEKPISLAEAGRKVDAVNINFDKAVMTAVREQFGDQATLIKAHYCMFNKRYFTHVVLNLRGRTISVLLTKLTNKEEKESMPRDCGGDEYSTTCATTNGYGLFVVSESRESDTLLVANTIFGAVKKQIANTRLAA